MVRVIGVGYDIRGNRIRVRADGDTGPVRELLSRFGSAVVVAERPFPWPTIPAVVSDPDIVPFEPAGQPAARVRRHGVLVEVWLSAPSVGQGDYVQAVARATNTRSDAVWMAKGECGQPSTTVDVDLSSLVRPGIEQDGLAASFKRRAVRDSGVTAASFDRWQPAAGPGWARSLASPGCTGAEGPA